MEFSGSYLCIVNLFEIIPIWKVGHLGTMPREGAILGEIKD